MAKWALGLAIVVCIPFGALVSIGLAVTVLVRSRDGRDHGKGLAIAALVVVGAWFVAIVVLGLVLGVLGAVSEQSGRPDRDSAGQVTGRTDVQVGTIRQGDCLADDLLTGQPDGELVPRVEITPCSTAHRLEVYHVFDLADGDYPGRSTVARQATSGCESSVKAFLGVAPARSTLVYSYFYPDPNSWRLGDHTVRCLIGAPGELTTGTLAGSGR